MPSGEGEEPWSCARESGGERRRMAGGSYIEKEEFHETWYELKDLWMPMERKEKLVPPKKALREFDDLLTERSRGKGVVKLKW